MLVYREWLNEYCLVEKDLDEFCKKMIMSGSNVEATKSFGVGIEKVVVGKVSSLEKHPDADKLFVCDVEIGEGEMVRIVTGADNVFQGAYVPVVLHGGKLPDGKVIKKGKLRGVESNGMLCSAKELGYEDKVISTSHKDGIWVLDSEYPLGTDVVEALGLRGDVVEFEITPNRPDCLSLLGMAREASATFDAQVNYPETECKNEKEDVEDYISVKIVEPSLCNRYVARVVTDIKIGQSPWWIQKRLMHSGMRPINNIVDITNYVMLEYGQPIHAFDIRNIKGSHIVVDTAQEGEKFITLDGDERDLEKDMLMIKDAERSIALAGVMGGLNSEIVDDTSTIVIESANFNGDRVRTTSKRLGLRTEASSRFEKGLDPELARNAADRVCHLIETTGAGTVIRGAVDIYPVKSEHPPIDVRVKRVNQMLGIALAGAELAAIFEKLEMKTELHGDIVRVWPPSVRGDLKKEIDFVEEAARIYGYDMLPSTLPKGYSRSVMSEAQALRDIAKDALLGMGYSEIQTYAFVNPKGADNIKLSADSRGRDFIRLINPLGEDNSVMRTTLTPNMIDNLSHNFNRNVMEVRAFELGNIFLNAYRSEDPATELESLCLACYGGSESFFTLKGVLNELFEKMGIKKARYEKEASLGTYHPGRCAIMYSGETRLGAIGELHPDVLDNYDLPVKVYCCELDFTKVLECSNTRKYYLPLPKYPSTSRDISLLIDEDTEIASILDLIESAGGGILESAKLFDIYRGMQVEKGKKSASFTLTYRAHDRTLTDEEAGRVHEAILSMLKRELNAVLRDI